MGNWEKIYKRCWFNLIEMQFREAFSRDVERIRELPYPGHDNHRVFFDVRFNYCIL